MINNLLKIFGAGELNLLGNSRYSPHCNHCHGHMEGNWVFHDFLHGCLAKYSEGLSRSILYGWGF